MALIKCKECGKQFSDMAEACPNCGYNPTRAKDKALGLKPKSERKSKAVALLLTFFLFWAGGDHFYLGNIGTGVIVLIASGISVVIGLYEFVLFAVALIACINFLRIACMSSTDFDQTYNKEK